MIYCINGERVSKETFEQELELYVKDYIPYSEYWTPKDKVKEELKTKRMFRFPVYDKRFTNKLVVKTNVTFVAVEEEIAEIESIVVQHEEDSLQIAVALYNAGYRKMEEQE